MDRTPPPSPRALSDRDHPLLAEAISLWNRHEFERSLFVYEQALAADPGNARIIINAARANFRRNRPAKGRSLLGSLVDAMPDEPRVHHLVGETLRLMSLPVAATAAFERAWSLGDRSSKTALELAALYEQAGRLDESERLIDAASGSEPPSLWAGLVRAQVLIRRRRIDEAAAAYRALAERAEPRSEIAGQAWAGLAAALDAQHDAAGAWAAIERCKAPQREADRAEWHAAEHVSRRFGRMIDELTPEHLHAWAERAGDAPAAPLALLGGFPRSGTTLLEQILDAHPRVRSVEERDVLAGEIFPSLVQGHPAEAPIVPIVSALPRKRLARARERYLAAMRDWHDAAAPEPLAAGDAAGTLLLDKNPGATALIPILRALIPSAPVIVALRDPRDVVLSCYLRYLRLNPVSVHFLTIERTAAKYAMDMNAWRRCRELLAAGWVEVRYEDLVADLEGVARRVLDALGVGWDPAVPAYRDRLGAKIISSPTYARVQEPVTRAAVGRWKRYEPLLAPVLPVLEPFVKAFGYE